MSRVHDWEAQLSRYIAEVARTPFAFGQQDCALFAAGAVAAITGTDPAAAWRGRYTSEAGGLRVIRKAGHADHLAAARALFPEVSRLLAMPGDLVIVVGALGVLQGEVAYVLREDGIGLVPAESAASFLGVR